MEDVKVVDVNNLNVADVGFYCLTNKKSEGYPAKLLWLKQQFAKGLKLKILQSASEGHIGFIEYIPGEYTWRSVKAEGYYVIHCIYVARRKHRNQGNGSLLVQSCITDARQNNKSGVAMVTSKGAWLADKDLLLKNGFDLIDKAPPHYELLVFKIKKGVLPSFAKDWENRVKQYSGWHLIYANQCPYHKKSVMEIKKVSDEKGLNLTITELDNPEEIQSAPSPFGVFNLIYNGKLLADHYISKTRFKNILRDELPV